MEYAKNLLKNGQSSLLDAAHESGLSGSSRLHDLFVNIERMTPGEFKNGGEALRINYCFVESPFGKLIVASTSRGVCSVAFEADEALALSNLKRHFPNALYVQMVDKFQQDALFIFQQDWSRLDEIKLHLRNTVPTQSLGKLAQNPNGRFNNLS